MSNVPVFYKTILRAILKCDVLSENYFQMIKMNLKNEKFS